MAEEKPKLPSISQLYDSKELETINKENVFAVLLNQDPKPDWIKKHPIAGTDYLPIERIEWLLTSVFTKWRVEIKETQMIANSIVVTVKLHYLEPTTMEWGWQEGVGAAPIHTKKDAGAIDFNQMLTDAVSKAAPAAKSYAVKDAADNLGKLFGKDLNRKTILNYDKMATKFDNRPELAEILEDK